MDTFLKSDEAYNYVELVLVNERTEKGVFDIHFEANESANILNHVAACYPQCKIFKKHSTKYLYDMLEQTMCENEISLHHMRLVDHKVLDGGKTGMKRPMLANYYNRSLLPNQSFPSTSAVVDVVDSKRVTVKINHSVYLNFDSQQYMSDGSLAIHIYANVNLGKSSDLEHVSDVCKGLIKTVQAAFV
jgi:hypothetical protein